MIKLTFEFNTREEAIEAIEKIYTVHYGDTQAPVQQPPLQQPPVQQAPMQQAPMQQAPVQQAPAPTPEELNQAMVEVSTRLNDNGAACHAIIQSIGVAGVAAMTDEQRTTVMAQVRAL